jgi:glycolate oxidase FAD binding subunit
MVGSAGKLGMMVELTFKVFPKPNSYATLIASFSKCPEAVTAMNRLASLPLDIDAMDIIPIEFGTGGYELAIRIGGIDSAMNNRVDRLKQELSCITTLRDGHDRDYWRTISNLNWAEEAQYLAKLPITPNAIVAIDSFLTTSQIARRYSVGGNVAWIATEWNDDCTHRLGDAQMFLCKIPFRSPTKSKATSRFGQAIKRALDPDSKFV